ncbi:MAG: FecR domain-containing protein [Nitrosomonas sp.]|uniref:FecR family protein n=1 Tax=Nitrosomonas sp. TaxID=42353 RepID=UPI0025F212C8|nr:FecR domain-containing protein [Nitrosomonas sp.]UJP04136.1 MAG: FecR domain-containing protein [Nitrosomonas sp.]
MTSMRSSRSKPSDPQIDEIAEQAADWIVRLSEDLPAADRAALQIQFEQWQQLDPHHAATARSMLRVIEQTEQLRKTAHPASARVAMKASLTENRKDTRARKTGVAVMLAFLLMLPIWLVLQFYPPTYLLSDARTATGEWHTQTLADHSTLTLNSASAVNFRFDATQRHLQLVRGEILIDVAADPERPFQVETRHGRIRALGTRFIVSLDEETTTLTMLESKAAITLENGHQPGRGTRGPLTLSAGERVVFSDQWIGDIQTIDTHEISNAWKFRHLLVENQSLPQVLDTLSRYRPGLIRYNRQELAHMNVSAVLPLDDIDQALYLLTRNFPIRTHSYTSWLTLVEAIGTDHPAPSSDSNPPH